MSLWHHYSARVDGGPDRIAVIDQQGRALTHGRLRELVRGLSTGLGTIGLQPGSILGVFVPNRVGWPLLALAAAYRGVGVLGLNTRFRHHELNHLLTVAGVDTVVVAHGFLGIDGPALMAGLDRPPTVIIDDGLIGSEGRQSGQRPASRGRAASETISLTDLASSQPDEARGRPEHPLIGFTTSGTTGFPKIAMHDQRQTDHHLRAVIKAFDLGPTTVNLAPLPLCGAFGYTAAMATLLAGGTVVAHETWDPDAAAAAIDEHGVTFCSGSDDMLIDLVASPRFNRETTWADGGFADFTNAGAEAVAATDRAGGGTIRLTGLYGSSEGFAMMSRWPRTAPAEERVRNGGHLIRIDMRVRCCDPESGEVLGHGRSGELQFRGPNLIDGYLNNPEATARAFTDDGWYRSGDLGHTIEPDDDGHQGFVYQARLGDTLRLRGFLCDPAEIETHLELHPAVGLAQVVGVEQPGVGDVAVAFVQPAGGDDHNADETADGSTGHRTDDGLETELLNHCRDGLANYKRPSRIIVVDRFPVTEGPNGTKIRKVELRERAARLLADSGAASPSG